MHNTITFRAFGNQYTMSYVEIAQAFGWVYNNGLDYQSPNNLTIHNFWYNISGRLYRERNNRAIDIAIPAFRIIYRCMATTLFGMGEPSHVSKAELALLWCLSPEGNTIPNLVHMWVTRMTLLQHSKSGRLACGGMVSLLVTSLGVQIPHHLVSVAGGSELDIASLRRLLYVRLREQEPFWVISVQDRQHLIPLREDNFFDIGRRDTSYHLLARIWMRLGLDAPVNIHIHEDPDPDVHIEIMDDDDDTDTEEDADRGEEDEREEEEQGEEESLLQATRREVRELREMSFTSRREQDEQYYDLQTQFAAMFAHQQAVSNYFASGGTWTDPTPAIERVRRERNDERNEWLTRRDHQRRHPRGSHDQAGPSA